MSSQYRLTAHCMHVGSLLEVMTPYILLKSFSPPQSPHLITPSCTPTRSPSISHPRLIPPSSFVPHQCTPILLSLPLTCHLSASSNSIGLRSLWESFPIRFLPCRSSSTSFLLISKLFLETTGHKIRKVAAVFSFAGASTSFTHTKVNVNKIHWRHIRMCVYPRISNNARYSKINTVRSCRELWSGMGFLGAAFFRHTHMLWYTVSMYVCIYRYIYIYTYVYMYTYIYM